MKLSEDLLHEARKFPEHPWGFATGQRRGLERAADMAEEQERRLRAVCADLRRDWTVLSGERAAEMVEKVLNGEQLETGG